MLRKFFTIRLDPEYKHSKRNLNKYDWWLPDACARTVRIDSDYIVTTGIISGTNVIALSPNGSEYVNALITGLNNIGQIRIMALPPKILKPEVAVFKLLAPYSTKSFESGHVPKAGEGLLIINCMGEPWPAVAIDDIEFSDEEVSYSYMQGINCNHPLHGNPVYNHNGKFLGLALGQSNEKSDDIIVLSALTISEFIFGDSSTTLDVGAVGEPVEVN